MRSASGIGRLEERLWRHGYYRMLGIGLALVITWAVLLKFVSNGSAIVAIHISFLIGTGMTIGAGSIVFFKRYMRTTFAVLLAAAIWVGMVAGIRSIILKAIGAI